MCWRVTRHAVGHTFSALRIFLSCHKLFVQAILNHTEERHPVPRFPAPSVCEIPRKAF